MKKFFILLAVNLGLLANEYENAFDTYDAKNYPVAKKICKKNNAKSCTFMSIICYDGQGVKKISQ